MNFMIFNSVSHAHDPIFLNSELRSRTRSPFVDPVIPNPGQRLEGMASATFWLILEYCESIYILHSSMSTVSSVNTAAIVR